MSFNVNEDPHKSELNNVKSEFTKIEKKIKNYETRPLNDTNRINTYKNELVTVYNNLVIYISGKYLQFNADSQAILLKTIDDASIKLEERLKILNVGVNFPED